MGLNDTPRAARVHIGIFGRRNAGKSSVINAMTGQQTALVSSVKGTTTDPVYKAMEILPLGPVVLIDTAGIDDEGSLGQMRVQKTMEVMTKTDIALVVIDSTTGISETETDIIVKLKDKKIPVLGVINKTDIKPLKQEELKELEEKLGIRILPISAETGKGVWELKEAISKMLPDEEVKLSLIGDKVSEGDIIVLVVPIDNAAPKGRLILPQQQVIRDILDNNAAAIAVKEHQLKDVLKNLVNPPKMVITDSQAFKKVAAETPENIPLTSFSIIFARNKGDLAEMVKGARAVENLQDGDKVLIAEACTHHRQSDDIGSVKIPNWLKKHTGKQLQIDFASGSGFPQDLDKYSLVIHCGACMINKKAMKYRIEQAVKAGVPIVNYGVLIAYLHGILDRAIKPFEQELA